MNWLRTYYYVWMPYVVMMVIMGCLFAYVNYAIQKSDHELCELIAPIEQANQQTPPTNPAAQEYAARIHDQFVKRGC